jgi:subtilase family serine protease
MGVSLFFSSGDNGVAYMSDEGQLEGCPNEKFYPAFPASAPHVTAVGATQFSSKWSPICSSFGPDQTLTYSCAVEEIVSSTRTGSRITSGAGKK